MSVQNTRTSILGVSSLFTAFFVCFMGIVSHFTYADSSNSLEKSKYIIEFNEQEILTRSTNKRAALFSPAVINRKQSHSQFKKQLIEQGLGSPRKSFYHVFNGQSVMLDKTQLARLEQLPNIKNITPVRQYKKLLDRSSSSIKAAKVWRLSETLGKIAGEKIKIAVLDSGIDNSHPMFNDANITQNENAATDDYCALQDRNFCNNKIITARSYIPDFPIAIDELLTPKDTDGHGTHVAGIAAGASVSFTSENGINREIQGVAPGAHLMIYKVLYRPASNPASAISDTEILLSALDQAYIDGADIINNSWGDAEQQHPLGNPEVQAIQNLEDAGVLVINAAGNSGELGDETLVCPACGQAGITVANTLHGAFSGQKIFYKDHVFHGFPGNGVALTESLQGPIFYSGDIDSDNINGCQSYPENSFVNAIALVERGDCFFEEKASNALAAGALALLVMDNEDKEPFIMWMPDSTLPTLLLPLEQSSDLLDVLDTSYALIEHTLTEVSLPQFTKRIAETSSRGPNKDTRFLKPDLAAPGEMITSASLMDGDTATFVTLSGTSMATPHISGAAAVIMSLNPQFDARTVKSILTSTADTDILITQGELATPFETGVGQVNLESAALAGISIDKVALVDNACHETCEFSLTITNLKETEQTWYMSLLNNTEIKQVDWEHSITLSALGSATVNLSVQVSAIEGLDLEEWLFDRLQFINLAGELSSAHLPVVIKPIVRSSTLPITTSLTMSESGTVAVNTSINVNLLSDIVEIEHELPVGASLVSNSLEHSTAEGLTFEQNGQQLSWRVDTEYLQNLGVDTVELSYSVLFNGVISTKHIVQIIDEDNALSIPLLSQISHIKLIETTSHNGLEEQQSLNFPSMNGVPSYSIERFANYGELEINNGDLLYQPAKGFYGEDEAEILIEYDGSVSHVLTVNILVENINVVPEIDIVGPESVIESQQVTFDASNTYDDDILALSYHWEQISGDAIPFENLDNAILIFVAPTVNKSTNFTFKLTVSDGVNQEEKIVNLQVSTVSKSSGGTFSSLFVLYFLLTLLYRFRLIKNLHFFLFQRYQSY